MSRIDQRIARTLVTGAVGFATSISTPASAADITHTRIADLDVITISGEIVTGDDEKFRRLSVTYNKAVVALDSRGGQLGPALEIGKVIKINEHPTVVTGGAVCASACALIWLAGATRFLSSDGRVGFHASYKDDRGRKVETGMGNAMIGHYLGSLNLPEKAVLFATVASPDEVLWLTSSNASAAGIDFKPFPENGSRQVQTVAQSSSSSIPASGPIAAPNATNALLRVGTEVPLRLAEQLTTKGKQLRVGQRFHLETAEPVLVQGVTVIPVGSPAVGEITDVRNKGMWGKSGHLAARVLYVTVNGRQIHLSGAFDDKGVAGGVGAVAVSAIVFLPAGFFMTGTSAQVPAGTIVKAFVDEDVPLAIASAAPPPLVVGTPATPLSVPVPTQAAAGPTVPAAPPKR